MPVNREQQQKDKMHIKRLAEMVPGYIPLLKQLLHMINHTERSNYL